jgi:hypothetical protein
VIPSVAFWLETAILIAAGFILLIRHLKLAFAIAAIVGLLWFWRDWSVQHQTPRPAVSAQAQPVQPHHAQRHHIPTK